MPDPSPLGRSIGLSGVIRFVIVVAAIIAIGAAVGQARYGLAIGGGLFVVGAAILGYKAWQARQPS